MAKHYERTDASGEAMVQLAMIRLMLHRLDYQHQTALRKKRLTQAAFAHADGFVLADYFFTSS